LGHRRYDEDKLKDQDVRRAFVLQVKSRFQALEHSKEEAETTEVPKNMYCIFIEKSAIFNE